MNTENSKNQFDESKKKKEKKERNEHEVKKENYKKMESHIEISKAKEKLDRLKFLVKEGIIDEKTLEEIKENNSLNQQEIFDIFEKINKIEEIKNIDKLLPKNLRISKEEYIIGVQNDEAGQLLIKKINIALDYMYNSNNHDGSIFNIFFGIFTLLNENIKIIHDNYIDIKTNLENQQK